MEELKEGWRKVKLEDLNIIIEDGDRGKNYPKNTDFYSREFCLFLNNKNIKEDKIILENSYYITQEKDKMLRKGKLQRNDIIITTRGSIGNVGLFHDALKFEHIRINSGMVILRNEDRSINTKYFYQLLKSSETKEKFKILSSGTAQPQLPIKDLKKLQLILPPIETQEKIASILSSLDDKIEINNEMNKTLEEMAQTLFKRWFIDFDFPNENGEPYRSSGGKMVDSELGEIPEGWKIGSLEEIVDNFDTKRKPLSKKERDTKEKKYPYYGAAGIIDYVDNYLFNGEYILLGEDGTVITNEGTPILNFINEKFWVSNHAHVIKAKEKFNNDFVHYLLRNTNVSHIVTGAVQPKINQKNLNGLKILIPKIKEISEFGILVSNFTKMLRNNNSEINSLTQIRDALLPKLMSGEIEV
ncbi:MAG: restriction endonuclease subunit S [Cetobacterium sp.]